MSNSAARAMIAACTVAVASGCGCATLQRPHASRPAPEAAALERLDQLERFAFAAQRAGLVAAWEGGRPEPHGLAPLLWVRDGDLDDLQEALPHRDAARRVSALRDRIFALRMAADPDVQRALDRVLEIRGAHGLGDQVALARALTEAATDERRRAWMSQADAARAIAPRLRELAIARRGWALEDQRTTFLEAVERHRGFDVPTAARLRAQVTLALEEAEDVERDPWDVEAASPELAQRLAARFDGEGCARRALDTLELAALSREPPGLRVVVAALPGSFADYASYAVDPPRDVRLRIAPGAGLVPQWSALHEVGHAAQALLAPPDASPLLRRPLSDAVSESCAKVFERLAFAPEWLRAHGVPEEEIGELAAWERVSERFRMRAILADTALEDSVYGDGRVDPEALARIAGVRAVDGVPAWALHRTVAAEPRGRFDYLLARCAQAAIYRRLRALPGGLMSDAARQVLRRDVLEAAAGSRFEEWFERAAGEPPSCEAWIEDVAGLK